MDFAKVLELENLSVRLDGLTGMSQAIRDCIVEGPCTAETYTDAVDLFSVLMYEFKEEFSRVLKEITIEAKKNKTA